MKSKTKKLDTINEDVIHTTTLEEGITQSFNLENIAPGQSSEMESLETSDEKIVRLE